MKDLKQYYATVIRVERAANVDPPSRVFVVAAERRLDESHEPDDERLRERRVRARRVRAALQRDIPRDRAHDAVRHGDERDESSRPRLLLRRQRADARPIAAVPRVESKN